MVLNRYAVEKAADVLYADTDHRGLGRAPTVIEAYLEEVARRGPLLEFQYRNWRGEEHTYVIAPEAAMSADGCNCGSEGREPGWTISGQLISRDGSARPELDRPELRRRTFLLRNMREIRYVEVLSDAD